jgi:dynein heavy chain
MGKRLAIFIDDMNMPAVDSYGTQQSIAMLKLLLDRGGCYDREKDLNWKIMKDIDYIGAMGKPGGGRNETDPRFMSLFSVFNLTLPSPTSLFRIYNSILNGHTVTFKQTVQQVIGTLTSMTLELYGIIIQELPPTPSKFHYVFNLRDLSRIYNGLCLTTPDKFSTAEQFIRVWRHEIVRVIFDRLISQTDHELINEHLLDLLKSNFNEEAVRTVMANPILFGDYLNTLELSEPRLYEDVVDFKNAQACC